MTEGFGFLGSFNSDDLPPVVRAKRERVVQTIKAGVMVCCGAVPYHACAQHPQAGLFCGACFQEHLQNVHPKGDDECDECSCHTDRLMTMVQALDVILLMEDGEYLEAQIRVLGWGICFDCMPRLAKLEALKAKGRRGEN